MTKSIVAALALVILPASAFAMCSGKQHQAMSCADGTAWDYETRTCVKQVSS